MQRNTDPRVMIRVAQGTRFGLISMNLFMVHLGVGLIIVEGD